MKYQSLQIPEKDDSLMDFYWPPVETHEKFTQEFETFLNSSIKKQKLYLTSLSNNGEALGEFIQTSLSLIYAYSLGYKDSPTFIEANDDLEIRIQQAKIVLERSMLDDFLKPDPTPSIHTQEELFDYLNEYIEKNTGVYHEFFDYLQNDISSEAFKEFLLLESIRNEVVDDEVALIVVGLQGLLKNTMASNLWDECGNGDIENFHTYWLRRLLSAFNVFDGFPDYREENVPWFASITSNSFNMMATRSCYNYRAYGSFLITESWVSPHFKRILNAFDRLNISDENLSIYFDKHYTIDPHHTDDMLKAILHQKPRLTSDEVQEVLRGAHTAVSAGTKLYEQCLAYFTEKYPQDKEYTSWKSEKLAVNENLECENV